MTLREKLTDWIRCGRLALGGPPELSTLGLSLLD